MENEFHTKEGFIHFIHESISLGDSLSLDYCKHSGKNLIKEGFSIIGTLEDTKNSDRGSSVNLQIICFYHPGIL